MASDLQTKRRTHNIIQSTSTAITQSDSTKEPRTGRWSLADNVNFAKFQGNEGMKDVLRITILPNKFHERPRRTGKLKMQNNNFAAVEAHSTQKVRNEKI